MTLGGVVRLLQLLLSVPAAGSLLLLSLWGRAHGPGHGRVAALPLQSAQAGRLKGEVLTWNMWRALFCY